MKRFNDKRNEDVFAISKKRLEIREKILKLFTTLFSSQPMLLRLKMLNKESLYI